MTGLRLTAIGIHPVKSTAIRPVTEAIVEPWGLAGDRRWMVVAANNDLVSARELHELFLITADTAETLPGLDFPLRLSARGRTPIDVPEPDADPIPVTLHSNHLLGRPADPAASAWIRQVTHRDDLTLVWCDDPTRRSLNPAHSRPGDHAAFADGYPVSIASTSSLARLNEWIADAAHERGEDAPTPTPMERFRPSLVIDGAEPFAEDGWERIRIGEVVLRKAKPIDRCVMTTIATTDLSTAKEPIRSLARHRRFDQSTLFAINTIPDHAGRIRVGDVVQVS